MTAPLNTFDQLRTTTDALDALRVERQHLTELSYFHQQVAYQQALANLEQAESLRLLAAQLDALLQQVHAISFTLANKR